MRALGVWMLTAASALQAAELATLTVRADASVRAERTRLGDVAEIAAEPEQASRLGAIDLGAAPAPGVERELTRPFLVLRLSQEKVDPRSVQWAGAARTRVTRATNTVSGAAVAQAAVAELRKALPWPDEDLVVEVTRPPSDLALLGSADGLTYVVTTAPGQRFPGTVPAYVALRRGDQVVGRTSVLLEVRVFQPLVLARRPIRSGERLTKDTVRIQRTELTSATADALPSLAEALDHEARQDIPAFAVVTRRMVGPVRVVRRGDPVTLLAESPRMRLSARGVAEQDGSLGQCIGVRNLDSQRTVFGRVVDPQTVQVPF